MCDPQPLVSPKLIGLIFDYTWSLRWSPNVAAPDTFAGLSEAFQRSRHVIVSSLHSENTIWGPADYNWRFRAWHDHVHLILGAGFDRAGEATVAHVQLFQAASAGCCNRDLALLHADTEGQQDYHARHGRFPNDQRAFVLAYLDNPGAALDKADW